MAETAWICRCGKVNESWKVKCACGREMAGLAKVEDRYVRTGIIFRRESYGDFHRVRTGMERVDG